MTAESWQLCTKRDEFIWDKPVWVAELSNGIEVWQDDDRPGCWEPSAWIRLGRYLAECEEYIVKFHLRFRSHNIQIQQSDYYYYTKGLLGSTSFKQPKHFSCVGHLGDDDIFDVIWYKLPELLPERITYRPIEEITGPEVIIGVPWNSDRNIAMKAKWSKHHNT